MVIYIIPRILIVAYHGSSYPVVSTDCQFKLYLAGNGKLYRSDSANTMISDSVIFVGSEGCIESSFDIDTSARLCIYGKYNEKDTEYTTLWISK